MNRNSSFNSQQQADNYTAQGYRRCSNKYRIIVRVDRPDWRMVLARSHLPGNLKQGISWVECLGDSAADQYRVCLSKDRIEGIDVDVYRLIPGSNFDPVGYIPVKGKEPSIESILEWNLNLRTERDSLFERARDLESLAISPCSKCPLDGQFRCEVCSGDFFQGFGKRDYPYDLTES